MQILVSVVMQFALDFLYFSYYLKILLFPDLRAPGTLHIRISEKILKFKNNYSRYPARQKFSSVSRNKVLYERIEIRARRNSRAVERQGKEI